MTALVDKREAHRLIDELADDATWEDLSYLAYLHSKLERARLERDRGLELSHDEVFRRLGAHS